LERLTPALLQASFALSPDFKAARRDFIPLPKELRFERFKRLRLIFFILLFLIALLAFILTALKWWSDWSSYSSLLSERASIQRRISALNSGNLKLARFEKETLLKLAGAAPGNREVTRSLLELAKIIPKDAWLLNFSLRGNSIDVSVRAPKGRRLEIMKALNDSKLFKVKNSNTRRGSDGSESVYVHLEIENSGFPTEGCGK
jgi:Tfp pilus assembly protein PilN